MVKFPFTMTYRFNWVFQTALFSTIGALGAPCLLPPLAVKSTPPAMRMGVDSPVGSLSGKGYFFADKMPHLKVERF